MTALFHVPCARLRLKPENPFVAWPPNIRPSPDEGTVEMVPKARPNVAFVGVSNRTVPALVSRHKVAPVSCTAEGVICPEPESGDYAGAGAAKLNEVLSFSKSKA